jgi:glucosamine-phosphate N-acetyltransferase
MTELQYTSLIKFIQTNPNNLEKIKKQYLFLLSLLTIVEPLTNEEFVNNIKEISNIGDIIICYIIDEYQNKNIVGTGTIIIEPKLIRGGKPVGHIEDIVVLDTHRSLGISTSILNKLSNIAIERGCYKTILDCKETLTRVYEKAGFDKRGIQMTMYYHQN